MTWLISEPTRHIEASIRWEWEAEFSPSNILGGKCAGLGSFRPTGAWTYKFRVVGGPPLWCAFRTQVGHRV